jgi:hypothetical protein
MSKKAMPTGRQGFVNILVIIRVVIVAGIAGYFALNQKIILPMFTLTPNPISSTTPNPISIPNPSPTPNPTPSLTPAATPQSGSFLSVVDLTGHKEAYVGKKVRVQGKIRVNVFYSEISCPSDGGSFFCDSTTSAQLEFWQKDTVSGAENLILLFSNNKTYPCSKNARETYACPPYTDKQVTTVEGVWSKDKVPVQFVGSSGSGPPTPIKWEDRYFLEIKSPVSASTQTPIRISSLSPNSGPVGTKVTIAGSGFTATENEVNFKGSNAAIIRNLDSADRATLQFIVPDQFNPCSPYLDDPCLKGAFVGVWPGSYTVSVKNANGVSNSLTFTVR